MAKEPRPKGYPKLKNYKPSQFMLPTSHYDKKKADRAVTFIENLCHTKGKWAGTPFWLLPWQEQLIRDIFGIVKPDGNRQFRTAFVEICKKVGKSELAAAIALYLLYADNEPSAEVYGAAADRQQASIVFDVAKQMVEMSPALMKRSKLMGATKRIVNYGNAGYYQVLSAEVGGKHGFSVSGLVFDEIHTQPNRQLYDVLTKGSSDARQNPLHFIITTAGNDRHSIAYELHTKAVDILEGRRVDPTFYPVVYGLKDDEDWEDEANWYKVNPSLGYTVDVERLRDAYREAKQNPADEITFKWLRCNMWVSSTVAWIPDAIYMREHPLYHLLHDEPNPEMTSFVFRETLMTHLLLWGNGYCQIIRNGKGEVVALYPLMPNRMTVDRDAKGRLYYQYQKSSEDAPTMEGSNVILDPSDVLHIPGLGFDGLVGYSPIAMASENITRDIINAREKKWKVVLPESFKIFMLDNNGVIPDERITIETGIALEKFLCIVPAIAESPNATDDIDVVITKYDEFMVFDEDSVGPDLIPFARLSGDKLLCLCYENKNPQIAVWSFEGSEDFSPNYKKVYSSFDEFLSANNIK